MTVYVESNFVLEIALGQEQSQFAERVLGLAAQGSIDLACPAFALSEPFATVTQRSRVRQRLIRQVGEQVRELDRSHPHQQVVASLRPIPQVLRGIELREMDLLMATVAKLLQGARTIETDAASVAQAMVYQDQHALSAQDAIIYAAIIADLNRVPRGVPHYFMSKNHRDFGNPGIRSELRALNCVYVESFADGLRLVTAGS